MTTIYAKHEPYETGHLGDVVAEMRLTGAPTIRVMALADGFYAALEGSHRLAAARYLGLGPKLIQLEPDAPMLIDWDRIVPSLPAYKWEEGSCLILHAAAF
jgi:hypothetical protein